MEIDLELGVKLAASTDRLNGVLDRLADGEPKAFHTKRVQQGLATAGVPTILNLGRPSAGSTWNVVQAVVMGSDDHTPIPGSAVVLCVGQAANPSLPDVVDPSNGNTVPNSATYGQETIWVDSGLDVYIVVYGAATGQSLTAVVYVDQFRTDDIVPKWSSGR